MTSKKTKAFRDPAGGFFARMPVDRRPDKGMGITDRGIGAACGLRRKGGGACEGTGDFSY